VCHERTASARELAALNVYLLTLLRYQQLRAVHVCLHNDVYLAGGLAAAHQQLYVVKL
jgi:hypothetical protein